MEDGDQAADVLRELLSEREPGFTLDRAFTTRPDVHALELERIWRRDWLFAGHSADVRQPGDLAVFAVGESSVILLRDGEGRLRAYHNTCRHRGSRLVTAPATGVRHLVCPYHQWTYGADGRLRSCGGMDRTGEIADPAEYGLAGVAVREVAGLIFLCLGTAPGFPSELEDVLLPQGLDRAKVAAVRDYDVAADWKLVWENNRECWHCHHGHPDYIRANFDVAPDGADVRAEIGRRADALEARLGPITAGVEHRQPGLYPFPSAHTWWSANRTPLADGWVTESLDGRPVAPLMGAYPEPDAGTLRVRWLPNLWMHASSDHAVTTRLLPAGPGRTNIRVSWLVDADAEEGVDYRLGDLLPFWQRTSEQDWELCERNQAGVRDPHYRPGPYSRTREANVIAFDDWYADRMAEPDG